MSPRVLLQTTRVAKHSAAFFRMGIFWTIVRMIEYPSKAVIDFLLDFTPETCYKRNGSAPTLRKLGWVGKYHILGSWFFG
jgi:hypothetical protein